jgi:two-component system, NarL family, nitrate/nitrite response regulator NarL
VNRTPILHIDRNQLFREGLRRILNGSPFYVMFEASSFSDGVEQIAVQSPSIVIIDTNGYGEVLAELMVNVRVNATPPRVVMLTDTIAIPRLVGALTAGIDGYLLKDMSSDALKQSLSLVLMGEKVFPTDLAHLLINNRFTAQTNGACDSGRILSARETEILACLVNGHSNKAIANRLQITEGTVKMHFKGVLKKINAQNRTQAAIWALQNGIAADVTSEAAAARA